MSRHPVRSLLVSVAFALAVAAGAAGFAGAASVEAMLDGALQPSAAPGLLGPISESGRTGWACKPEQAAAAKTAGSAELPAADSAH